MKGRMKKNKCITKKERAKEWKERARLKKVWSCQRCAGFVIA
jgi:Zn-finger protein